MIHVTDGAGPSEKIAEEKRLVESFQAVEGHNDEKQSEVEKTKTLMIIFSCEKNRQRKKQ